MRVLVVGSGPIGRRHVENVLALGHEAAVARRVSADTPVVASASDVPVLAGLQEAGDWEPEAVIVANPPSEHLFVARWAIDRRCPVLVEKPLGASLDGVDSVLQAAARAGVHLAVGHNLRFHPALRAVKEAVDLGRIGRLLLARAEVGSYLPDWHPGEDYRLGSAARRELGGGALLTLIHELDLVLWIAGDAELIAGVHTKVSGLNIDVDDVAELVLRHASGTVSSVHMDLVDRAYNRRSRWVGEDGTIEWTWGGPAELRCGNTNEVLWDSPLFDLNETYLSEVAAFLRGEPAPGNAVTDARRALEIAASVRQR